MNDPGTITEIDPRLTPEYQNRQPYRDAIESHLAHVEAAPNYRQILAGLAIDFDVDLSEVQSDEYHWFVSDSLKALHDLISVECRVVVRKTLQEASATPGHPPQFDSNNPHAGILVRFELN